MSSEHPDSPESLPKYISEGLPKQDVQTLRETAEYIDELIELMTEPVEIEPDADEEVVDVEESADGSIVIKKVPCGKDCNGCPHGPYKYRVYRQGNDVVWDYQGKVNN
jgi:hypothetical protein